MLIARNEAATALAFSPACMTCPNRTPACAMNFDEVALMFGEEKTRASLGSDTVLNHREIVTPKHPPRLSVIVSFMVSRICHFARVFFFLV